MSTVLPIVAVDRDGERLTTFAGPDAVDDASKYIGRMADAHTGCYGISVSDDQCSSCEATFSREAWIETDTGWACPQCATLDPRL